MSITALTTTEAVALIAIGVILVAGIGAWLFLRKRRTARLQTQFGGAEYDRAVKEGGSRRHAEAGLDQRKERVERFHIRPLALADRARFLESWRGVQSRFVDGPVPRPPFWGGWRLRPTSCEFWQGRTSRLAWRGCRETHTNAAQPRQTSS